MHWPNQSRGTEKMGKRKSKVTWKSQNTCMHYGSEQSVKSSWIAERKTNLFRTILRKEIICTEAEINRFFKEHLTWYRMILKKVSFGIFRIILVSNEENNSTGESNDKVLLLSKLSWYLVIDSLSKSSKLDIWRAISAKKIK